MLSDDLEEADRLYANGNAVDAFPTYKAAALAGSSQCQRIVGWMYYLGEGVGKDILAAESWFKKSAVSGDIEGKFGWGCVELSLCKYEEAQRIFGELAQARFPPAVFRLGWMEEKGCGRDVNIQLALKWYREAASLGNLEAEKRFAVMTLKGWRGVVRVPVGFFLYVRFFFRLVVVAIDGSHRIELLR
ncbi:tetratricopeptide repeat protein [Arhodomonas sp. AD133]|uniref:tetratricopeptide repeat protein n=1 Tax=Arhodomonas sp. AD133 TaxID=3415009 RepID=UPI003EBD227C